MLAARILDAAPLCTFLTAPAGYGKSRLARALVVSAPAAAFCDITGLQTRSELARKLVAALLAAGLPDSDGLAEAVATLSPSPHAAPAWDALLDAAWTKPGGPPVVVVENAEAIAGQQDLVDQVARLASLATRRMVVCSRVQLESAALRRLPPHEILRVGVTEFEFTSDETVELLVKAGASRESAGAAIPLIGGWPIAALVCARAAADGSLDRAVAEAGAMPDLEAYVVSEALAELDAEALELLGAAARIGTPGSVELAALGTTATAAAARANGHPFFTADRGSLLIHPLARTALLGTSHGLALLSRSASSCETNDPVLAARLHVLSGASDRAAMLLGTVLAPFLMGDMSAALASLVSDVGVAALRRDPTAWAATISLRAYAGTSQQMLDEARAVWKSLPDDASLELRLGVGFGYANYLSILGRFSELERLLEVLQGRCAALPLDSIPRSILRFWTTYLLMLQGGLADLDALRSAVAAALDAVPILRTVFAREFEARAAVMLFDRDAARGALERSIEFAARGNSHTFVVICIMTAAFHAWFSGEDALYRENLERLQAASLPAVQLGTSYFLDCCLRDPVSAKQRHEMMYHRVFAAIIAASRCSDAESRQLCAEKALDAAEEDGTPLVRALAWLCAALAIPTRREQSFEQALRHAGLIEGGTWTAAIERLRRDGRGPLASFAKRFSGTSATVAPALILRFGSRRLGDGAHDIVLTSREFVVLTAIMHFGREVEPTRLAATIFPDDPPEGSVKAIRVWVSRLRAKFAGREVVVSTSAGYRAAANVSFDFAVAEVTVGRAESGEALSAAEIDSLNRFVVERSDGVSLSLADTEWAAPLLRRAEEARRRTLLALARCAYTAGDFAETRRLAEVVLDDDPVDEAAVELKMRSCVAAGAKFEARRAYKQYEAALRTQSDGTPADHLVMLLGGS